MIGKLLLFFALVVVIRGKHQEDDYDGSFLPNGCPTDHHVHWLLPHDTDCSKFYHCNFGDRVERDCAPGTLFNYLANPGPVCDWPENVNCDGREPTSPPPTESTPEPTETPCPPPTTCPPTTICPPVIPPVDCDDDCVKPWPDESDCDKFWKCKDGTPTIVTCSEGLHFNAETGACDFICNAGCTRSRVQGTWHEGGLKIFMPWEMVDEELRNTHHIRHESTAKKINSLLKR